MSRPHVVVVGGGIAGLAAAHALRDHDVDVTVVDGAAGPGGKLRTSAVEGLDVEDGAETFLARVPDALDLVRAVGLEAEIVHPRESGASVWSRGRLRRLPARTLFGVPSSVRSVADVVGPAGVARAALDLVLPGGGGDGDESIGHLVRRRLGDAVADRLVDPLLGGVYAGRADELSARATVPQLAGAHGSLVRATRAVVPAPTGAPVFAALRGGMSSFVEAVAASSGARVITGRLARRLERTPSGFRVVHGATTDEQAIDADAVVVAVPAAPASRLLADVAPAAAGELSAIDYASLALVTTVWRRDQLTLPAGSGYLVPAVEGRPVKAVTFLSAKWAHLDDAEHVVVRCSIGRHGDEQVLQRDDAELLDLALAELALTCGATAAPVAGRVVRWGGGLPQYAVGHLDRVGRIRADVAQVRGLAVCGAAYEGVGIPACIRTGRAAAAQVVADLPTSEGG